MEAELVSRAMAAATALAAGLGLQVDDVVMVHNSNKIALRLLPCDVLARVAVRGRAVAALEVELARRLAATASPVAALEPRVKPRIYERDGFTVTFWTYYEPVAPGPDSPATYADALHRLHSGLRRVDIETPHFGTGSPRLNGWSPSDTTRRHSPSPTGICSSVRCRTPVDGSRAAGLPSSYCMANRTRATS